MGFHTYLELEYKEGVYIRCICDHETEEHKTEDQDGGCGVAGCQCTATLVIEL